MLQPVVCFDCGSSLDDRAVLYNIIRRLRMEKKYGPDSPVLPANASYDPKAENVMGDVLDALGVTGCCRKHVITTLLFEEQY